MTMPVSTRLLHRIRTLIISLLAVVGLTLPGHAQVTGLTEAMQPEYFTRDLIIFIEGLDLDENQQLIIEALFDDYEQSFNVGIANMENRIEEIQGQIKELKDDPQQVLEMVLAPIEDWVNERQVLGDQLIENVRVILIPEQETMWIEFTRKLEIEKQAPHGILSGEGINLYHTIRDMSLDQTSTAMIQPAMNTWASELQGAMRKRARLMRGPHTTIMESINASDSKADIDRKLSVIDARIDVRNVNDHGIESIAEVLQGEERDVFLNKSLMVAYPKAYNRQPAQRILEAAAANTTYSEDVQVAIDNLLSEYLSEVAGYNDRILLSVHRHEPEYEREKIRNRQRKKNGEDTIKYQDPTREIIAERKKMGLAYIERLKALLTPEEFNELPGSRRYSVPVIPGVAGDGTLKVNNALPAGMRPDGKENPQNQPTGIGPKKPGPKGKDGKGGKGDKGRD